MNKKRKRFLRVVIAVVSCVFILHGTARGEVETVGNKAVNICLECIGLG